MRRALLLFALLIISHAQAQLSPGFLQNGSYWGNGKAEFNIYEAQVVRYGEPRPGEVLHIIVPEPFDPKQWVKPEDWRQPGLLAVMKMNQVLRVPTGVYVYQQMHSSFWRLDDGRLWKFSLTSNDSCGNTYKEARRTGDDQLSYHYHTYWDGMAEGTENVTLPANAHFYDELPLIVRLLDFSKTEGTAEIQLTPSVINAKKDAFTFAPARIAYKADQREITITVEHAGGTDRMLLDREFPHLLREWKTAEGGSYRLKRSLRIDYWNYNKPGDLERVLKDPKFEHPD